MTNPSAEPRFEVGEIAIIMWTLNWPEYDGQECTVIGPLCPSDVWIDRARTQSGIEVGYRVKASDGHIFRIPPHRLRKRRPPQDWVKLCRLNDVPTQGVPA